VATVSHPPRQRNAERTMNKPLTKTDYLYFVDNKRHKRPHIHVKYQGYKVVLGIPEGDVLEGSIPKHRMKLVEAWVEIHQEELMADWELAVDGQQPYKIEPLR
jgi:hypothetical protein